MTCEHLRGIMGLAESAQVGVTNRGRFWSGAQGEWIYYHCRFDRQGVERLLELPEFVHWHEHHGTHDGMEAGFVCVQCQTGVMGLHPADTRPAPTLPGRDKG